MCSSQVKRDSVSCCCFDHPGFIRNRWERANLFEEVLEAAGRGGEAELGRKKRSAACASLRAIQPQNVEDLIQKRHSQQRDLDAPVARKHGDATDRQAYDDTDWIFDSKRMKIRGAFKIGIDDVGSKSRCEDSEKPIATREEILFVAGVVLQIGRKEQRAKEVEEDRVKDDEEVACEGPLRYQRQAELPPPEVNDPEQKRGCPAQMKDGNLGAPGMLDETCEAVQQRRYAQPDDDRNHDSDVKVKFRIRLLRAHLRTS